MGVLKKAGFNFRAIANRIYAAIIFLLVAVILLSNLDSLHKIIFSWELDSLTIRQKWKPPQSRATITPITLVNIDSQTMGNEAYHQAFNTIFSRKASAYAIRFFKRTTPKSILFDTSFNGGIHHQDLVGDQLLADSAAKPYPKPYPVASALSFEIKGNGETDFKTHTYQQQQLLLRHALQVEGIQNFPIFQKNYSYNSLVLPYLQLLKSPMLLFSANASVHKTNLDNRADDTAGLSRRWTPFSFYGGQIYPTFALGALLNGTNNLTLSPNGQLVWNQGKLDLGPEGVPLIKWYGHGADVRKPVYPEFSFADIVLSEISLECQENPTQPICSQIKVPSTPRLLPQQFKDRHILIGFVIPNSGDEHVTIYSPKYPGVYILANTLDNALNNDFVRPAPGWLNLLLFLALPLLLIAIILRFHSVWISQLMMISLCAGHFLLCVYAYHNWNLWLYAVYPISAMLICYAGVYVYQYMQEHKMRQQMRFAFGKYVSPSVLQIIEKHPEKVKLGGERRKMTFLFSDIRGFTRFSDQNSPEVVQAFLTQYFTKMNTIIMHSYGGSINKLIGDAIMAYWGFPLDDEDHAFQAVSAALAMRDAMHNWEIKSGMPPIQIGIGINTGEAVIGNVGSEDFMDFTVIGDAVNVASRLEGANKLYGTTIIISAATFEKVKDRIHARPLGMATLKGKETQIEVYEPLSLILSKE